MTETIVGYFSYCCVFFFLIIIFPSFLLFFHFCVRVGWWTGTIGTEGPHGSLVDGWPSLIRLMGFAIIMFEQNSGGEQEQCITVDGMVPFHGSATPSFSPSLSLSPWLANGNGIVHLLLGF